MASPKLRTVLGDVEPGTMAGTLPHEHLLIDEDSWWAPGPDPMADSSRTSAPQLDNLWHWHEHPTVNRGNLHLDNEEVACAEIGGLRESGIGTLIEVTSVGLGRNPLGLRRIAITTGLNIVAGAGFYVGHSLSDEVKAMDEEEMVDHIVGDIEDGIDNTDVRAGVIGEVGLSWPIEPVEERGLAAAVRAMKLTGAALAIHSPYFMRDVDVLRDIVERLHDLGADIDRVVMGHCDSFTRDPRFIDVASSLGCVVEFDLFGQAGYEHSTGFTYPSDEVRVEAIAALIRRGLADRVMLSHDVALKTCLRVYGGHGYEYVPRVIFPWLRRLGADQDALNQILVRNGQRIFPIGAS